MGEGGVEMKEEALKLADELDALHQYVPSEAPAMIRRLVEELDKTERKYKDMHNLATQAMSQVHQLEKDKNKEYNSMTAKPTITKLDGKVIAVTMTDDEHSITEVLWEAPKPLSNEEIDKVASIKMNQILMDLIDSEDWNKGCTKQHLVNFARAIEERHGIK